MWLRSGKLGNGRVCVDTFGATLDRKTAGVELIVRCVQFRSALTTNNTGFASTKHEQGLIVVSRVETVLRSVSGAVFWAAGAAAGGVVI